MTNAPHAPASGKEGSRDGRAYLLLALAVLCFATLWPATKIGLAEASPMCFAAARAALGCLGSFALLAGLGRLQLPSRRDLPAVLSIGLLQMSAFFAFMNLGLSLLPAGRSIVLGYTTTLWLVPLALLVGEPIDRRRALGVAVGLAGVAVLCNPLAIDWSNASVLGGHAALLLAALAWALTIFHANRHRWQRSPFELLPWQFLSATVVLTLLAWLVEPSGGIGRGRAALLSLLYIGLFAGPVGTWASVTVASRLPTLITSLGFLAVPVLGMLLATLALGEPLGADLFAGGGLVLAGLVLVALGRARG